VIAGLLDTAVLVDLLRAYPPAEGWLSRQSHLGVTPVVWLEIIEGAANLRAQARAVDLLRHFEKVDLSSTDFDWSVRQALQFRLSHNVGMMDCLIASTAHRISVPLYTPNLKHFSPILGSLAVKPY